MSKEDSSQVSRRGFLAATGAAITGISGCMGEDSSDSNGTSAQGAETPSNAGTDTPGNNNQRNAPTGQGQDQDSTSGRNEAGQGQDSMNGEIDIPDWENADDLYETQKATYKGVDKLSDQCAFTVDPDYIDGSELEPSKYDGQPTTEHKLKDVLNGDVEYKGDLEELTLIVVDPEDYSDNGSTSLELYGNGGRIMNVSGFDPSRESQVDAFEHIDGEGVLHSSEDLPEYVEQVLTEQ
jgi:hypothetical protein